MNRRELHIASGNLASNRLTKKNQMQLQPIPDFQTGTKSCITVIGYARRTLKAKGSQYKDIVC